VVSSPSTARWGRYLSDADLGRYAHLLTDAPGVAEDVDAGAPTIAPAPDAVSPDAPTSGPHRVVAR